MAATMLGRRRKFLTFVTAKTVRLGTLSMNSQIVKVPKLMVQSCKLYGAKYSRLDRVKFFKDCLPQTLLGSLLNTLSHIGTNM